MTNFAHSVWRCFVCGETNPLHISACENCSNSQKDYSKLSKLFDEKGHSFIQNNIYTLSSDKEERAEPNQQLVGLTEWLLRILSLICIGITGLIFMFFFTLFYIAVKSTGWM